MGRGARTDSASPSAHSPGTANDADAGPPSVQAPAAHDAAPCVRRGASRPHDRRRSTADRPPPSASRHGQMVAVTRSTTGMESRSLGHPDTKEK